MEPKRPAQPDFADVVAFLGGGDLHEERAQQVRQALGDDPELARAGLDAVDPEGLAAVAGLSPAEVDRAWARFQEGLAATESSPPEKDGVVVAFAPRRDRVVSLRPAAWALAATLLAGIGLGVLLAPRRTAPPSGKVLVASLALEGGSPLRSGVTAPLSPGPDTTLVLLLQPPSSLEGVLPERVRCRVSRGGSIVADLEATLAAIGPYAVELDPARIQPGEHRIELVRYGEQSPFAAYAFVLAGARP